MVKAIRVHEFGGPQVLKWEDVEIGEPKEGEVHVRNKAIGVNFIDVYFGKGVDKAPSLPFTPGPPPLGSYAEEQILPANKLVSVPPKIDPIIEASIMSKGMTTRYLLRSCFKVEPGHTILVHAAAGGMGSLLCQWANTLGATVIGTVSNKTKAVQAKEDGCHHVIIYTEEDFVARVNEITSGNGVEVVYDSVGKSTFEVVPIISYATCI
ncbi:uncharacterized protein LOC130746711 isoform X3 [Lotus japonicus]|uniref:Enoyl reductase (ER) domain-containing protein n=1 Tax=Lotus japonicus TaxID=34305 RepID=I3SAA5_LOTJA|nr:uncharacterized protein LOC130746711 isoform X3 [Lotus japonicus]AFK37197.1 unknown [Lotus japonicus]